MLFHYSYKKLFNIFLIRMIPSLVFLYIALWIGEVFWVATIALWVEAVVEVALRHWKGYCRIDQDEISTVNVFFPKGMKISEIKRSFTYDGEWAFISKDAELRLNRNQIRQHQRIEFEKQIKRIHSAIEFG